MKYLSSSNQGTPECSRISQKWISSPSRLGFLLIVEIIFLNSCLVTSSSPNSSSVSFTHRTVHHSLDHVHHFSWPISMTRSKRNLNNIFVDLESDQSIYHHPSPVYTKKEFGQSDYWASIKRKWQQSEQCPCQCVFDQLNRKVIKCDEQFANVTSIPSILDPNVEVSVQIGQIGQAVARRFINFTKLSSNQFAGLYFHRNK